MKKVILFLLLFVPSIARSQGVSVSGQAIVNQSVSVSGIPGGTVLQAVPNAQITVCSSAGGGIPCTPLVTIYSCALVNGTCIASNPLTADANGNFSFFVPPNATGYVYSQTGAGIVGQLFTISPQSSNPSGTVTAAGIPCTNGELVLSAGWQSTGSATVTAVAGNGQTCSWTITTGTTTAANPTITDTLTNVLPNSTTVCEMNIHGGTHTAAAGEGFQQTTLSATAPIFTFNGTPTAGGTTYFVTRRCGP